MPNYTCSDHPDAAVKNKLGAATHDELEKLEAARVAARDIEIQAGHGPQGQFDAAHLKAIHRHLFQDVYEWAGRTRDERVLLSDRTIATEPLLRKIDGNPFLSGPLIPKALADIAAKLRDANYLRDLPRAEFAACAADVMVELNTVHPFREGNGRTQRAFMRNLAKDAGHDLDFSVVTRERMVQASIAGSDRGDPQMMRRLFDEISHEPRVAALDRAIDALNKHNFPWNDHYIATTEPGHKAKVTMAGIAGGQFMSRTAASILIGRISDLPEPRPGRGETFTLQPGHWDHDEGD